MPIYEYHCESCEKNLEVMQKMSEAPKKKCPACGGKLAKLMSSTAFQLKGTGWYKTDYASKTSSKKEEKPSCGTTDTKAGGCGAGACATGSN